MQLTEKVLKPITETAYLTAENVQRYRVILRFFYIQYEQIKYWMDQEEIYEEIHSHSEFSDYTMEQCRQDLDSLVKWKNLLAMQDTKKVTSVEAFKNRQYRYQLTDYGVEIERMTMRLEQLKVEGASLEPTLLERMEKSIRKIQSVVLESAQAVYRWWDDLNNDFKRLNQNYQDYMRDLNSVKAEELMKSTAFFVYKDRLIEYLRSFVKGLQKYSGSIERIFREISDDLVKQMIQQVMEYERSIPRVEQKFDETAIYELHCGRWNSIFRWFVGVEGSDSEASRLFDLTNESIRKITRYATQISDQFTMGANRKEEYKKIAEIFFKIESIQEAHCLAAMVFGVEMPMHLKSDAVRQTDSINSGVYEEAPLTQVLKPRVRTYGEKLKRSHIQEHKEEKERAKREALERIKREKEMMDGYIVAQVLDFKALPIITPQARMVLLKWLSKALEHEEGVGKTEDGRTYRLTNREEKENFWLKCEDGNLYMPAFRLEFEEKKEAK